MKVTDFDRRALAIAWLRVKAEQGKRHAQVVLEELEESRQDLNDSELAYDSLSDKYSELNDQLAAAKVTIKQLQQMTSDLNEELRTLRQNYTVTNTFEVLHG